VKGLRQRRKGVVRDARTIALALEGEEVGEEFRYFDRIRASTSNNRRFIIELLPTPSDTHQSSPDAVIDRLDAYVAANALEPEIDILWLVIDVDAWPEAMLGNVAQRTAQKRYRLGISNPCFELWLLLHFDAVELEPSCWPDAPRRSQEAKRRLSHSRREHGARDALLSAAFQAMLRAEQLIRATPPGQRWPSFPGTHVHMILDDLRNAKLLPEQ
jgi:hypothetical protein